MERELGPSPCVLQPRGNSACQTIRKTYLRGFRACARTPVPTTVPKGRLNLAQDASPGLVLKGRPVPKGRLEIGRDAILDNLQTSLRVLIMFRDVPSISVLG